jgi:hypothetical protein
MHFANLVLLLAGSVAANAVGSFEKRGEVVERYVDCKIVTGVLSVLKGLGGPATSFCSSYLSIGTATVTNVVTPATR